VNLRSIRVRLAALYTLLSAVAVIALAIVAVRVGTERIEDGAVREAELVISDVSIRRSQDVEQSPSNTWLVHIDGDEVWEDDFEGDTWVEPPLYTVGAEAIEYDVSYTRFEQDDTAYLVYGKKVNDTESLVTAVDLTYYSDRASSLRLRMTLAAAGAVVGIAVVGWFVSGRSLAPIRAANTRQRDFIADAAHELRTPLAVIRASSSQALSKRREAEDYVEALTEIDSAAENAGAAVSELLELARIDSGQFNPRLAPLRLDLLAEEVVAGIRVDGCELDVEAGAAITVDADYALLHHAVGNVVRNAAARASMVSVRTLVDGKRAIIEVADDGPGFPPELLADVFDRFRRGDTRGSSGLGLAIARSIIAAHKGGAEASNRDAEGGAIVRLWLPATDRRR